MNKKQKAKMRHMRQKQNVIAARERKLRGYSIEQQPWFIQTWVPLVLSYIIMAVVYVYFNDNMDHFSQVIMDCIFNNVQGNFGMLLLLYHAVAVPIVVIPWSILIGINSRSKFNFQIQQA